MHAQKYCKPISMRGLRFQLTFQQVHFVLIGHSRLTGYVDFPNHIDQFALHALRCLEATCGFSPRGKLQVVFKSRVWSAAYIKKHDTNFPSTFLPIQSSIQCYSFQLVTIPCFVRKSWATLVAPWPNESLSAPHFSLHHLSFLHFTHTNTHRKVTKAHQLIQILRGNSLAPSVPRDAPPH